MIASPEKLSDMKERVECMQAIEDCLKNGEFELAKKFGELSQWYAERIKRNEYKVLDKKWKIYHKLQS